MPVRRPIMRRLSNAPTIFPTFNEANKKHVIVRRAFYPPDNELLAHVCCALDENLRAIEQGLNVVVTRRQEHFRVEGGKLQAPRALALIEALYDRSGRPIDEEQLQLMLYE